MDGSTKRSCGGASLYADVDAKTAGMFNELALTFAVGTILATAVAILLPDDLGAWFLPIGIAVMVVSWVAGGGLSQRTPLSTPAHLSTTFARMERDTRFTDRRVSWNFIYKGVLIGTALTLAGLVALAV